MRSSLALLFSFGTGAILASVAGREPQERTARATLRNAEGKEIGKATLVEGKDGVRITVTASRLPQGLHGFHIHERGSCDVPGFESAGGHFNPFGKKHGLNNKDGPHAGDLPNLPANELGVAEFTTVATRVTLAPGRNSLLGPGGTSLVIHEKPDDLVTDPAGNSGARLACGSIEKP